MTDIATGSGAALAAPGARVLPPVFEALRRLSGRLGTGPLARRGASILRRLACLGRADPIDVELFPGHWARLHPRDNLSEKRAFASLQHWDVAERAALAEAIAGGPRPFVFVDAGANVGLYSLAARAAGGAEAVRVVAIEPDPVTRARLGFNLGAAPAGAPVSIVGAALSAEPGTLRLTAAGRNRGEVRVAGPEGDGVAVPARTLLEIAKAEALPRIDALKIDIEGAEAPVLRAFFEMAPVRLWPALVLIEAPRGIETQALALLRAKGYAVAGRTKLNAILTAPRYPGSPSPAAAERSGDRMHGEA